jgi:hypothetical protein
MRVLYLDGNPDLTRDQLAPEGEPMTNPKILAEPEPTDYSTASPLIGRFCCTTERLSTIS